MAINIERMVNNLNIEDEDEIDLLLEVLEDRKRSIQFMEPILSGSYDKWEERFSDIEDIYETCESLKEETNLKKRKKIHEELKSSIGYHQAMYGGLKRFRY